MAFSPLWRRQGMRGPRVSVAARQSSFSVSLSSTSLSSPSALAFSPSAPKFPNSSSASFSSFLPAAALFSTLSSLSPFSLAFPLPPDAAGVTPPQETRLHASRRRSGGSAPRAKWVLSRWLEGDTSAPRMASPKGRRRLLRQGVPSRKRGEARVSPQSWLPPHRLSDAFFAVGQNDSRRDAGRSFPSGVASALALSRSFSSAPHASPSPLFLEKFLSESVQASSCAPLSTQTLHASRSPAPSSSPSFPPSSSPSASSTSPSASPSSSSSLSSSSHSSSSAASSSRSSSAAASQTVCASVSLVSPCEETPTFFAYGASQDKQLRAVLPLLENSTDPRFLTNLLLSLHALPDIWRHVLASPAIRSCRLVFPVPSFPFSSAVSPHSSRPVSHSPSASLYARYLAQFGIKEAHVEGLLRASAPASLDLLLLLALLPHVSLAQPPVSDYKPFARHVEASRDAPRPGTESSEADEIGENTQIPNEGGLLKLDLREALPLLLAAYHPQRPGVDRDLISRLVLHFTQASLLLLPPASPLSSLPSLPLGPRALRHLPQAPPRSPSAPAASPAIRTEIALWLQHTVLSLTPQTLRFFPQLPIRLAAALHAAHVRLPLLPSPPPSSLQGASSLATASPPTARQGPQTHRGWEFGRPREEEISSAAGVAQWEVVDQVGAVVLLNQLDVIEELLWKVNWSRLSVSAACRFFREAFDSRHLGLSGLAMQKAFAAISSRLGLLQTSDVFNLLTGIQHLQHVAPQEQREIVCSSAACLALMWPHARRFLPLFSVEELAFACEVFAHEVFVAALSASGAHRLKTLSYRRLAVECRRQEACSAFFDQNGDAWQQLLDAFVARRAAWPLQTWVRFLKMLEPLVSLHQLRNEALCAPFSRTLAPPSPLVGRVHRLLCLSFGPPDFEDKLLGSLESPGVHVDANGASLPAGVRENLAIFRRHLATLSLHELIDFLVGMRTYGYVHRPLQRLALTEAVRRIEDENWTLRPEDICRLLVASEDFVLGNPMRRILERQLRRLHVETEDLAALMALVIALERQPTLGVAALFDLRKHIDNRVAGLTAAVGESDVAYSVEAESPMTAAPATSPKLPLSLLPLLFVYLFSRPSSLTASSSLLPRAFSASAPQATASSPSNITFLSPLSSFLRTLIPELLSPFLSAMDLAMLLAPLCTTEAPISCYASHFPTLSSLPSFVRFLETPASPLSPALPASAGTTPAPSSATNLGASLRSHDEQLRGEQHRRDRQQTASPALASLSVAEAASQRFSGNVALVRRLCRAARQAVPYTPLALLRVATGHAILHAHANQMVFLARSNSPTAAREGEAARTGGDGPRGGTGAGHRVRSGDSAALEGIAVDLALGHIPTLLRMLRLLEMDADPRHLQRLLNVLLVADLSLLTQHRLLDLMEAFVAARTRLGPVLQRLLSWFSDRLLRVSSPAPCLMDCLLAEIALCAAALDFPHSAFQSAALARLGVLQGALQASLSPAPASAQTEIAGYSRLFGRDDSSWPHGEAAEPAECHVHHEIIPSEALRVQIRILLGLAPTTPLTKRLVDHFRFCVDLVANRVETARQGKEEIPVRDEELISLYEIYLCLLLRAPSHLHLQETDAHDSKLINFLLKDLPRLKWLERERSRSASFRLTEESRQLSAALRRRGLDAMKPVITGICFCHFASVSASRDAASRGPTGVALVCVPEEETLASWTVEEGAADETLLDRGDGGRLITRGEEGLVANEGWRGEEENGERWVHGSASSNARPLVAFGESRRRIAHLKKAGWVVLPLFITQWRQLRTDLERDKFLRNLTNLS
ncbi:conserved hypothetical protein [Neospora caninum Liverpool]|uniref:Uncharacterized protein n=1 Tax=Neospora caninum (strain Liverpool) TaxID=572307 RepID=F0VJF6_NEOCL|nr:conserved hypothetical protein [Neospora caninum Liverpool]CBZ53867.1 conserved hypothetical protein [Neospora caninum Liverpool]CEL67862.1 TPA: hypothetical protein BN1204_036490 [Neospora caninum Liverpool]|eukprot:XP_003883899.1 conserved hypothetical protein [Neospora caninum Liverpool]